ncbi:MAG: AAA family ATPase [Eubacterium sp.]|nr:AAA family ATPase [Eubacterium sp.]
MNIKEAKEEIINTVEAYLKKDDTGAYEIPIERQRPVLLMGPPGIGKTAIMEQVASELHINLVSYTITHHTRQSAIGLPFISHKNYDGREYAVTEYTMSEIVASIYDRIEKSGIHEGILFLDEINCVSETLAPTMLQFLQYKTFGTHRVPDGFVIVTAGNPPQYNKSVRDLDIVTLDRVKRINIDADFDCWKEYAYKAGVHGSILAYLEIKKDKFYSVKNTMDGARFVTARGWEDLSRIIRVYEELGKTVSKSLTEQYLQDDETAEDFAAYYELYRKYRTVYRIPEILEGTAAFDEKQIRTAPFDEKLSLISLLIDALNGEFREYAEDLELQKEIYEFCRKMRETAAGNPMNGAGNAGLSRSGGIVYTCALSELDREKELLREQTEAHLLDRAALRASRRKIAALTEAVQLLKEKQAGECDAAAEFAILKDWFTKREADRRARAEKAGEHLTNSFSFLAEVFGEGQEMVIFLTELAAGYYSLKYVSDCGNEAYYKYNKLLLLKDRRSDLRAEIDRMLRL